MLDRVQYSAEVGTEKLYENNRVRLWDFSFPPGAGDESIIHQHTIDYVFVVIGHHPHKLLGYNPDGSPLFESINVDGDVEYTHITHGGFTDESYTEVALEARHGVKNGSDQYFYTEFLLELK